DAVPSSRGELPDVQPANTDRVLVIRVPDGQMREQRVEILAPRSLIRRPQTGAGDAGGHRENRQRHARPHGRTAETMIRAPSMRSGDRASHDAYVSTSTKPARSKRSMSSGGVVIANAWLLLLGWFVPSRTRS